MRNYQSDETVLAAFRPNWERLGEVARRLSCGHGNLIITQARTLHKAGAVEQRMWLGHLQWRRAASAIEAGTAETEGLRAKPASAVAASETPQPSSRSST